MEKGINQNRCVALHGQVLENNRRGRLVDLNRKVDVHQLQQPQTQLTLSKLHALPA